MLGPFCLSCLVPASLVPSFCSSPFFHCLCLFVFCAVSLGFSWLVEQIFLSESNTVAAMIWFVLEQRLFIQKAVSFEYFDLKWWPISEMCYVGSLLCVLKFHGDWVSAKLISQSQVYIRHPCFTPGVVFDAILAKSKILVLISAISAEVWVSRHACNI